MANKFAEDYIDVAERIRVFREAYPEGSLQPNDLNRPYTIETIGGDTYIVVVAAAYRTADDVRPGVGMAYETYPGRTPYTKGSELQNAETSAWGRAIVAVLAADTKKGIASAEEVRNRQAERDEPKVRNRQAERDEPKAADDPGVLRAQIAQKGRKLGLTLDDIGIKFAADNDGLSITAASTEQLVSFRDDLPEADS